MKKYILFAFIAVFLLVGVRPASAATIAELQAQIQALSDQLRTLKLKASVVDPALTKQPTAEEEKILEAFVTGLKVVNSPVDPITCVKISRSLYFGKGDANTAGEVSILQRFLKAQGYYTHPTITGFFGPATEDAVERFQAAEGVVSVGTPDTTGFGAVGGRTRGAIEKRGCNTTATNSVLGEIAIKLLSPNGGEKLEPGRTYEIKWRADNYPDDNLVILKLKNSTTGSYDFTILSNYCAWEGSPCISLKAGSYLWTVPTSIPSGTYTMWLSCGKPTAEAFCLLRSMMKVMLLLRLCLMVTKNQSLFFLLMEEKNGGVQILSSRGQLTLRPRILLCIYIVRLLETFMVRPFYLMQLEARRLIPYRQ